ncbi:MAG: sulfur-oxidizing protein SoxY [Candidatus Azotimanducaceae bacterium]
MSRIESVSLSRRALVKASAVGAVTLFSPQLALASPAAVEKSIASFFDGRIAKQGKVTVKIPPITENGTSVAFMVSVDSPMTLEDHVVRIAVFAEENPVPDIARFELGPRAGIAKVESRIRMNGSQNIRAIAEMNDGSLWSGHAFSIVTLAACLM